VLSVTQPISRKLQAVQIDFCNAATIVTDAIAVMQSRRVELEHFDTVFESASQTMKALDH